MSKGVCFGVVIVFVLSLSTPILSQDTMVSGPKLHIPIGQTKPRIFQLGFIMSPYDFDAKIFEDFVNSLPYFDKYNLVVGDVWDFEDSVVSFLKTRGELIPRIDYYQIMQPQDREKRLDQVFAKFKEKVGYYPKGVFMFQPDTYTVQYAQERYGVEYVHGYCFDQWIIDWMTMRGGWQAPYYGRKDNLMVPSPDGRGVVVLPHLTWDWIDRFTRDHHYNTHIGDSRRVSSSDQEAIEYSLKLIDRTLEGLQPFGYGKAEFEFGTYILESQFPHVGDSNGEEMARQYYKDILSTVDATFMTDSELVAWFRENYEVTPTYKIDFTSPHSNQRIKWRYSTISRKAWSKKLVSFVKYREQRADPYLTGVAFVDFGKNIAPDNSIDTSLIFKVDRLGGGEWNPSSQSKG